MKKVMLILLCVAVFSSLAAAQYGTGNPSYSGGATGIQGIDKLGAHQNGGRGCVGCHAPHSGARGNGGALQWDQTLNAGAGGFKSVAVGAQGTGDETLWGQDLTPLYGHFFNTGNDGTYQVAYNASSPARIVSGVMMCLSCHDGNFAKGAMMTNQAFEQVAGLLPTTYGTQPIPTLLGNDGTGVGNYSNDHPIGPLANLGTLGQNIYKYFALNTNKTALTLVNGGNGVDNTYATFISNYGSPLITGARSGAGIVVETTMTDASAAYVVCTTCHTPHSMYTATAGTGGVAGTYPSFFFIAAPYNPAANTVNGTKASSATQFCRQCHFKGAGGSNEGSGISIPTAF